MKNFIPAMFLSGLLLTPCHASGEDKPKAVTEDSAFNNQRIERGDELERLLKTFFRSMPKQKGVILFEETRLGVVTRQLSYQPYTRISGWGGEATVPVGPLVIYDGVVTRFPIYVAKVRKETGDTITTESYNLNAHSYNIATAHDARYNRGDTYDIATAHDARYNPGDTYDIATAHDARYNPGDTVSFSLDEDGYFIVDEDYSKANRRVIGHLTIK